MANFLSSCALGALIDSDKHPDLPRPLSEFFAKRAKILVEYELDLPKVATVQTFSILSCHEATRTRDSRGWLYAGGFVTVLSKLRILHCDQRLELTNESGAAARISLDLGLHIDTATRVRDGSMDSRTAYARSVAFWGSFLIDR